MQHEEQIVDVVHLNTERLEETEDTQIVEDIKIFLSYFLSELGKRKVEITENERVILDACLLEFIADNKKYKATGCKATLRWISDAYVDKSDIYVKLPVEAIDIFTLYCNLSDLSYNANTLLHDFDFLVLNNLLVENRKRKDYQNSADIYHSLTKYYTMNDIPIEIQKATGVADTNRLIRSKIVDEFYIAFYRLKKYDLATKVLNNLKGCPITEHIIINTDYLIDHLRINKKIIATFDPEKIPKEDEQIICYGNYPNIYENLVINNPCYRHNKYFYNTKHDIVEYWQPWDAIDVIYVINLDHRIDRWYEVLDQCRKMGIPLHKVKRFSAVYGTKLPEIKKYKSPGAIGCFLSHLSILKLIVKNNHNNTLVLEDDFIFNDHVNKNKLCLQQFFDAKYEYDITLLATHAYGKTVEHDDLLLRTYQHCTCASGYFVSLNGAKKLIPIKEVSLEKLKETGNRELYANDVSWNAIQKDNKFFVFKWKLGYQRPGFSDNDQSISTHLY